MKPASFPDEFPESGRIPLSQTAFDVDGVVMDLMTPFIRRLNGMYQHRFRHEDITEFDLENALGISGEVVEEIVGPIVDSPIERGVEPYPHAEKVLENLSRRQPLLFVTARKRIEPVREWFAYFMPQIPINRIELIAMGDHMNKLLCLQDRHRTFFVDDRVETCLFLRARGITPLLFDQPWNRSNQTLTRINGWLELERTVDEHG